MVFDAIAMDVGVEVKFGHQVRGRILKEHNQVKLQELNTIRFLGSIAVKATQVA